MSHDSLEQSEPGPVAGWFGCRLDPVFAINRASSMPMDGKQNIGTRRLR
jgi:hypothetical protein